jgi:hypothetical protein
MPLNVKMSVGCAGKWDWGPGNPNLYDIGFASDEGFPTLIKSIKIEIDGPPAALLEFSSFFPVIRESGIQDVDLSVPLPFVPPNPDVGQTYDLICKVTAVVSRVDGTEPTTLTGSCMCSVSHNG